MNKAFTLLELIIVILVISILSSFIYSKFYSISNSANLAKLKSEVALIQNGIAKLKQKNILLSKDENIILLDNAVSVKKDESLFVNIIDFNVISTDNEEKEVGRWIKKEKDIYEFVLSSSNLVKFVLKDSSFYCKGPDEICKELF